jgi:LysM repeat protein
MKQIKTLFTLLLFLGSLNLSAQTPEKFRNHRVSKKETLSSIIERYGISKTQLLQYNPLVDRVGIKRKMTLRIPVYKKELLINEQTLGIKEVENDSFIHLVAPKETKWRLAYIYNTTIRILDSLNPQIKEGLKIGQRLIMPTALAAKIIPEKDSLFNYYKVLPKEGFYRIEKKLGVNKRVLDSLNPNIETTGLQPGMILKIPGMQSGVLKVENDLLVERVNLLDSTLQKSKIKLGILLPFRASEIVFDSIVDTEKILEGRNLHTISLDFYTGVQFAIKKAAIKGIDVELTTLDTENNPTILQEIIRSDVLKDLDFIVGPLIPKNFNIISNAPSLSQLIKIAPLSSVPVVLRKNVFQSVTEEAHFRSKMYRYLVSVIDTTQNVVIVADSSHRDIEKELKLKFPWAITIRPELQDYILPELVDSLLVDSLPNKVLFESKSFPLIASAISQFNAQNSKDRKVQVFTTFRGNAYDNENLSLSMLGGVKFTYPVGFKPLDEDSSRAFIENYINYYGKSPTKEALRGYDVTLDAILRTAVAKDLKKSLELGETGYSSNRFLYHKNINESFSNKAFFILQHKGYEILEIKE